MSTEISFLSDTVILFGLSSAVIVLSHRWHIPSIIGFLLTGVLAGPHGFGLVSASHEVQIFAEIGVIFLLFVIGMELSLEQLIRLRRPVFVGGAAQVGLTVLISTGALLVFWQVEGGQALFLGFLAALSSTAIVLKLLGESAQMSAPYGRIALGSLIFQDIVVVPMMLLIPLLAGVGGSPAFELGKMAFKAVIVGVMLFYGARRVVPVILRAVIRTRSRELFLMTVLGLCFAIALLTSAAGLSLSLGAFLAGLIMSESEYSLNALEGVLPFRDVFTSLFFVSIGMLLNPLFVLTHLPSVLLLTLAVLLGKGLMAALAGRILGYPWHVALVGGLCLFQIGEFSFVLAGVGLEYDLLSTQGYQYFLATAIVTMALTPFCIAALPNISSWLARMLPATIVENDVHSSDADLENHLIIAGFGLGGQHLARAARSAGISYVVLEMNPETVRHKQDKGEHILYGDASQAAMLEHVQVRKARVLAIVISDPSAISRIVSAAHAQNPGLHILVRTRFVSEIENLLELGAQEVIAEEYETSIEMFTRVLSTYLVPRKDIQDFVREIRAEGYGLLRNPLVNDVGTCTCPLNAPCSSFGAIVLRVSSDAFVCGKSLMDIQLRKEHSLTVVAVQRDTEVILNPTADWIFIPGDLVHVFGNQESISEKMDLFEGAEKGNVYV